MAKDSSSTMDVAQNIHPRKLLELPLDWEQLDQISEGNREFERELLQIFVSDAQLHLPDLQAAIAERDFPKLKREAHYLKGSSANVGAIQLQRVVIELERYATEQQVNQSQSALIRIGALLQQMAEAIGSP